MTEPLRNLLQQADAAAPGEAPLPADLGPGIRRRVRQRRQRRTTVAAAGVCCTAILGLVIVSQVFHSGKGELANNPPPPPPRSPSKQIASVAQPAYVIDPMADARDDAACTMVFIARRRARNVGAEEAAAVYRRTFELFPETHWAAIARRELASLPH
jgi:hypothetical protein